MTCSLELYLLICVGLFFVGTLLGRFLNRCVLRLPQHFEVHPAWKHVFETEKRVGFYPQTRWYHRLPVIGTSQIVGRSPYSGRRVLKREPWLEILNGFLVVLTFLCTIPHASWGTIPTASVTSPLWAGQLFGWGDLSLWFIWGRFVYFLVLVEALFVATFIDFDLWIIPDGVTFPAMVVGFFGQILGVGFFLAPIWLQDPSFVEVGSGVFPILEYWPRMNVFPAWIFTNHYWHAVSVAVTGFIVGGGIVWAVRIIGGLILRREAMGFGDVILMAMIGLFIGWQAVCVVFFLAPMMALLVLAMISLMRFFSLLKIPVELPYGPYLSLATLVVLFGWRWMWPALERIFSLGPLLLILSLLMLVILAATLYLLQTLKRLFGVAGWEDGQAGWRSSDQLVYLSGENVDLQQGNWRRDVWNGTQSGRGQLAETNWKTHSRPR